MIPLVKSALKRRGTKNNAVDSGTAKGQRGGCDLISGLVM